MRITRALPCVAPALALAAPLSGATLHQLDHHSASMDRLQPIEVLVPETAEEGSPLPVLYILHGAFGNSTDWRRRSNLEMLADSYQMVFVMPDGGLTGWYLDSPIDPTSKYETYITDELIPFINANFPVRTDRDGRAIMGLSMGGHGASILSLRNPELFSSCSSLSGILQITAHPDDWNIADRLGPLEQNRKRWEAHSALELANRFAVNEVAYMFDCGTEDIAGNVIGHTRDMHDKLKSLGIPHIAREFPGGHDWDYWTEHLQDHLNFHQGHFSLTTDSTYPGGPISRRWDKHFDRRLGEFAVENADLEVEPEGADNRPRLVLLGDSHMERFPMDLLPEQYRGFNRGVTADGLGIGKRGVSTRMELSVFDIEPDVVVFISGHNDLGDLHRDGKPGFNAIVNKYQQILAEMRQRMPNTRIIVTLAGPLSGRFAHLNADTVRLNTQVKAAALAFGGEVIDLHAALVDKNGELLEEYTAADGLHLSDKAYEVWARLLQQELGAPTVSLEVISIQP